MLHLLGGVKIYFLYTAVLMYTILLQSLFSILLHFYWQIEIYVLFKYEKAQLYLQIYSREGQKFIFVTVYIYI